MAQSAGYAAHSGCALSSDDAGENRALASNAQKPHPARELLSARRPRSPDQCVRRVLQPPALSREHRQSYPGRRLLRTWSNHPAGKRKDQTQNHPKPSVASQQASRITSIQDGPDSLLDQAASCLKISDDGQSSVELTAWDTSPSARNSSTERPRSSVRWRSASNSRTFSIAMAA